MNDEIASRDGHIGSISTQVRISKLVVTVVGSLDTANSAEFTNAVELGLARSSDVRSIVFEMSATTHLGHSGLSALLKAFLDHKDLDMCVQDPSQLVADLLDITGLASTITIVTTDGSRGLTDRPQP